MLTNELERLGDLHRQGLLTDEEFAQAKSRLLTESGSNRELQQLRWQAELERIDREWVRLEDRYKITVRYGHKVLPTTKRMSLFTTIVGSLGICFLVTMGILKTNGGLYFVAFGVIMIAVLVACGVVETRHRTHYEEARACYEKQRSNHLQRKPR